MLITVNNSVILFIVVMFFFMYGYIDDDNDVFSCILYKIVRWTFFFELMGVLTMAVFDMCYNTAPPLTLGARAASLILLAISHLLKASRTLENASHNCVCCWWIANGRSVTVSRRHKNRTSKRSWHSGKYNVTRPLHMILDHWQRNLVIYFKENERQIRSYISTL